MLDTKRRRMQHGLQVGHTPQPGSGRGLSAPPNHHHQHPTNFVKRSFLKVVSPGWPGLCKKTLGFNPFSDIKLIVISGSLLVPVAGVYIGGLSGGKT